MPTIYVACLREQVTEWVLIRQKLADRWKDFAQQQMIIGDPQSLDRVARAEIITRCDLFILHYSPLGFVNSAVQSDLLEARSSSRVIFVACAPATSLPPDLAAYPRLNFSSDARDIENGLRVFWRRFRSRSTGRTDPPRRITVIGLIGAALLIVCILAILLMQLSTASLNPPTMLTSATQAASEGVREVASAPLSILDSSGRNVGAGTIRIYAPAVIYDDETAYIRLVLDPASGTAPTAEPAAADSTEPAQTEAIAAIFQQMGAQLVCAEGSFLGCDSEDEVQRSINSTGNHVWSWILTPLLADGRRDTELRLFRYLTVNDSEVPERIWSQLLPIRVRLVVSRYEMTTDSSPILLIAFTVTLAAGLGVTYLIARAIKYSLRRPETARPTVFMSYQHESSAAEAWILSKGLAQRGIDVWVDFERIFKGHFKTEIDQAIRSCDLFVALLTETTLQSEWVRLEIMTAVEQERPITCVLQPGLRLDELVDGQPDAIRQLREIHHLTLTPPDYDVTIERLARAARPT